jgi:hypothetical protein
VAPSSKPKHVASKSGEAREGHPDEHKSAVGDIKPDGQHEDYWVLSDEDANQGYTRPFRKSYVHVGDPPASGCGAVTIMSTKIAATYARDPSFYGSTFCCRCKTHFSVGQFKWDGTNELVGS